MGCYSSSECGIDPDEIALEMLGIPILDKLWHKFTVEDNATEVNGLTDVSRILYNLVLMTKRMKNEMQWIMDVENDSNERRQKLLVTGFLKEIHSRCTVWNRDEKEEKVALPKVILDVCLEFLGPFTSDSTNIVSNESNQTNHESRMFQRTSRRDAEYSTSESDSDCSSDSVEFDAERQRAIQCFIHAVESGNLALVEFIENEYPALNLVGHTSENGDNCLTFVTRLNSSSADNYDFAKFCIDKGVNVK